MADCLQGNRKAQHQLYEQLYGFAITIAMRYAVDEQEAADIVSHAFVKMFQGLKGYSQLKGNFHGWFKKILINEALDIIKKRTRFSTAEIDTVQDPAVNSEVLQQSDAAAIMQLVKQLPPATKAVFLLYAVDGYAHKEIATRLNISQGTSKWHLSEARKLLQQKLQLTNNN